MLAPALGAMALLAAPAAAPDVWAKLPAPATSCYQSSDDFPARLEGARRAVEADRERQAAINAKLSDKVKALDPMEMASRQQQYMMDHPQEALALMQAHQAMGESVTDRTLQQNEKAQVLQGELTALDGKYKAALESALAPNKAKFDELDARASKDLHLTEAGAFYKPWAVKEYNALVLEERKAYEAFCREWWGASGPYHAWLKRYKQHLADFVPRQEEADRIAEGFMMQIVGTPDEPYRSLATHDAVLSFAAEVEKVLQRRRSEPTRLME